MRIAVTGASGNVGTALLRRLARAGVEVVGICRRIPLAAPECATTDDAVRWEALDVAGPGAVQRLTELLAGVDAVVHAAWLIQPARQPREMTRVNLGGSRNVVRAAVQAGVPHLVHLSSVGSYATHPGDDGRVQESWPTTGIASSQYSREKATVEAHLDAVQEHHPELVVSRVRPALVFQRDAGSEIARYFLGGLVPTAALHRIPLPALPVPRGIRFQVVHADDLADAIARVLERTAGGAFNVADEPVLTGADLAAAVRAARVLPANRRLVRLAADVSYRAHLHPVQPGWLDLGYGTPVMDTTRAREVLGWEPAHAARDVLAELLTGIRDHAGTSSPALRRRTPFAARTGT